MWVLEIYLRLYRWNSGVGPRDIFEVVLSELRVMGLFEVDIGYAK